MSGARTTKIELSSSVTLALEMVRLVLDAHLGSKFLMMHTVVEAHPPETVGQGRRREVYVQTYIHWEGGGTWQAFLCEMACEKPDLTWEPIRVRVAHGGKWKKGFLVRKGDWKNTGKWRELQFAWHIEDQTDGRFWFP
ncbi:MAG: hypothetical protein HYZ09_00560 [Candidatus Kerfeldbacteria bacterium]|nr:hypothetical protein [Candidatus Kerfeldbacteria bacterium]